MGGFNKNILAAGLISMANNYATGIREDAATRRAMELRASEKAESRTQQIADRDEQREYLASLEDKKEAIRLAALSKDYTVDGQISTVGEIEGALKTNKEIAAEKDAVAGPVNRPDPIVKSTAETKDEKDHAQAVELKKLDQMNREELAEFKAKLAADYKAAKSGADGATTKEDRFTLNKEAEMIMELSKILKGEDGRLTPDQKAAADELRKGLERLRATRGGAKPADDTPAEGMIQSPWASSAFTGGKPIAKAPQSEGTTVSAPPAAVAALKADPKLAAAFKQKYGYLPEGF
jgi:hypothetical protein